VPATSPLVTWARSVIVCRRVSRTYQTTPYEVLRLDGDTLTIENLRDRVHKIRSFQHDGDER
jgi:hypothetical protein